MSGVWQAGWVTFIAAAWTAVTYFKSKIFAGRPISRRPSDW
jgi:hypothetical protein